MKLWGYLVLGLAFSAIFLGLTGWVSVSYFGLHFQIDTSSVPSNNTAISGNAPSNTTVIIVDGNVMFAKIALQSIPTLINGITTSTSIIVGFSITVISFMVREFFQGDKKARNFFIVTSFTFIYIFMYLFWVYVFLATGGVDIAIRWSLDGLLLSLLIFMWVMLIGFYRIDMQKGKKFDDREPEEDKKTEQEKQKPDDTNPEEKSKSVNVVVNVNTNKKKEKKRL